MVPFFKPFIIIKWLLTYHVSKYNISVDRNCAYKSASVHKNPLRKTGKFNWNFLLNTTVIKYNELPATWVWEDAVRDDQDEVLKIFFDPVYFECIVERAKMYKNLTHHCCIYSEIQIFICSGFCFSIRNCLMEQEWNSISKWLTVRARISEVRGSLMVVLGSVKSTKLYVYSSHPTFASDH